MALPVVVNVDIRWIEGWLDVYFDYILVADDVLFCAVTAHLMELDDYLVGEDLRLEPSKSNIKLDLKLIDVLPCYDQITCLRTFL